MTREPAQPISWRLARGRTLSLDRPRVIAILNTTPDSFSDGGLHDDPPRALAAAGAFIAEGADMLDIGGESTRPGSARVPADEQIRRTLPVIRVIRGAGFETPISIDTTLASVAEAALDAGADAINDVSGGEEDPGLVELAARHGCGLIMMHRFAPPERDRYSDRYDAPPFEGDVVGAVRRSLQHKAERAVRAGCDPGTIVLDPGLGFGKTVEQNAELARRTPDLVSLGFPILAAASRKSFVGRLEADGGEPAPPPARLGGSIAFSLVQLRGGARLFRVHDVRAQSGALRVAWALGVREME